MKVILFGATGMVGQGVLRECLIEPDVESILSIGRGATGIQHRKLRELVHTNLVNFSPVDGDFAGYDACFFCLGISSAGMTEQAYYRVTYDITLAVARTLVRLNPDMTFVYVSGTGTDSTERGRTMWARVKGKTENALLGLPFKAAYMLRPGYIQPMHGTVSKTKLYRMGYALVGPLYPGLNYLLPDYVTTTEKVGRAMIAVARQGAPKVLLENKDINKLSKLK